MAFFGGWKAGGGMVLLMKKCKIIPVQVRPGTECVKITYPMRVRIAQARAVPNVGCNKPVDPRESR